MNHKNILGLMAGVFVILLLNSSARQGAGQWGTEYSCLEDPFFATCADIWGSEGGIVLNSTAWNRSGTNTYLANIGDSVGIGTVAPQQELNVIGSINATGNLTVIGGGKVWGNSTCLFLTSPDGSSTVEVCND